MSDTLRAAAQQALEALDEFMADYQSDDGMNSMKHYAKQHHAAITTLRAALAEPTVKDSLTVASDTLPPLPERLRTYSADQELSDRYSDAMQEAADEIERLQAGIRELVAASGAETMGAAAVAEPVALQGGLDNEELRSAWAKKLPGVAPTERDLSSFAVGVEVGFEHARDLERQDWSRIHHVLKKHGVHPGRTDELLCDVIDRALSNAAPPQREPLGDCNRGNKCPWSDESAENGWRSTCRRCGLRAQGAGQ